MKTINRINRNDTIKATLYGRNRNYITHLYDSGFSCVNDVISRFAGRLEYGCTITVYNESKGTLNDYNKNGRTK